MSQQSDANEAFKRNQQRKLESMLGLCEQVTCRRQTLLAYFDEALDQPCGHCDNCTEPPTTWDATEAARKALSCVFRTGQRFGANYVIDVLTGKPQERILRNRHDQISTWGIGTELSVNQWRSLFRQLLVYDYLESDSDQYGGMRLTRHAKPLLSGNESLMLREVSRIKQKSAPRSSKPSLEVTDQTLFDALRSLRKSLADERGVPPYVVFHDKSLLEMTASLPANLAEMANINGVGEQKLERFGEPFLAVIREHQSNVIN